MVPGWIVDADAHEPAEQKVVFQPLHKQPLRAHRVERLQQHRPEQLLGWDRRPPEWRIQRRELPLQSDKRFIHNYPDGAKRVIAPNPRLQINVAEQLASQIVTTAHSSAPNPMNHAHSSTATGLFQQPARASLLIQSEAKML